MSETYAEIMRDLNKHHYEGVGDYCNRRGVDTSDETTTYFHDAACDVARRVREAVAGDPTKWHQLDADGNEIRIGDVFRYFGKTYTVYGLVSDGVVSFDDTGIVISFRGSVKKISETQDEINADINLKPIDYCEKYGLDTTHGQRIEAKTKHLLERQRKLDGVE